MRRKLIAITVLVIWAANFLAGFAIEASAATPGVFSIKNDIVELLVNGMDGRYAIRTVEGSPDRAEDNDKPLLYLQDIPETTFTTFRIDGNDYIYGNSYSGLSMDGGFTDTPVQEGMAIVSTWKADDVEIAQKLEMTDNVTSSDLGNVKISYTIKNTGTSTKTVGSRILMDTMLGDNDGSKVSLDGKTEISYETEVSGDQIPVYWRSVDSATSPKIVSYGFLKGWGNNEPDRMIIAHWNALSLSKWDYTINPSRNIGSTLNDYQSADSAVALYWEPRAIEPGETVQVETYYGLGNISSNDGSTFNLNVMAPSKLTIEGDRYKENPFEIMMELDNSLSTSTELARVTAELLLPDGLELAEDEQSSRHFYKINVGGKETVSWKVKAQNTQRLKVLQYMIRITSNDVELKSEKKYIIVPGFENNNLEITYTDVAPRNLYYSDENNYIQLVGLGFDKLRDRSAYTLSLSDNSGRYSYTINSAAINVVNDTLMSVKLPASMNIGTYRISINHREDMLDYTLPQEINLTGDQKYKSRNYGILAIMEETPGVHTVNLFEKEDQLTSTVKSKSKLIIRGKVNNPSSGYYEVYGDTIAINNDIYYKGYENGVLHIFKNGNSYRVQGNGKLYMQSSLMGSSVEVDLKKGYFYIDSANTEINDQEGEFNDITIIQVGYFPILVKKIKIQNSGEVKIDGLLQLDNKYFNFLTGLGTGSIKSDLKDLSLTNKKIEIDTEIEVPFPRWKLGNFQSKDYATKTTTQVTFFINTIKGAYGFQTKAENPTLKLMDINAKMGFDKNLYPDYFEFSNNYGKLPRPIGSTGLGFEKIGGGIYGLKSMFDSLKYGILPTGSSVAARADIIDLLTANARIKGYTLVGLRNIEAILSSSGLDLDGDAYLYFIDVGDIVGHFDFSGGYIQADLNVLDILIANAYLGISSNEIMGSISAKVKVPGSIPIIGGKEISSFSAKLSTSEIAGSVKFMGIGVGIKYSWKDNDVDFSVKSKSSIESNGIYTAQMKDGNGDDVLVSYGTNIERMEEVEPTYPSFLVCYAGDLSNLLAMAPLDQSYIVNIDYSFESAILEMRYVSAQKPNIKVYDPDGIEYVLIDEALVDEEIGENYANYRNQIIPASESASGNEEKYIYVTIPNPKIGDWRVESDKPLSVTPLKVKDPAGFESVNVSYDTDLAQILVNWRIDVADESKASLYKVDFYLVNDDNSSAMIKLHNDSFYGDGEVPFGVPLGVTSGKYKVKGEVTRSAEDGSIFSYYEMYSDSFDIVDSNAPAKPAAFTVQAIGNGMLEAEWAASVGADEYRIYPIDEEGNIDRSVKAMINMDGSETGTIFGGTQTDSEGVEFGWIPGKSYRFAIYAVSKEMISDPENPEEEIEIEHISTAKTTGPVFLPMPAPPEFTVDFTSEHGNINIEKDDNDNDIRYTNISSVICSYESDTNADIAFYINGINVASGSGKTLEKELELDSGSNLIELEAVKANGDKALKSYEFYYDNSAPDLMVQSPTSSDSVKSGKVLISGKTTAGSRLYVNGTSMPVEDDGSFEGEYVLSSKQIETITIAAVDLAGNTTEYTTEVLNADMSDLVKVRIKPQPSRMNVGDSIQLRLYGVTRDNSEVLLEVERTEWQLYDTEGRAVLTNDGLLTVSKPGEIVVQGRYTVSGDLIYEDAIVVNAPSKTQNNDNDNNNNDNNSNKNDSRAANRNGINAGILVKKAMDFRVGDELSIPGLLKLRFTGNEVLSGGYIEVYEISDLLHYRQQIGNKDFLSTILDIIVPEGYRFNSPVDLTMYFDRNKVKNIKQIGIYVYNEKTEDWNLVGGTVDEKNGTVTVTIPHFSKYAVMENSGITVMTDMDGHWARDYVYRLIDRGIVNGIKSSIGDYRFEPERTVTRAEFAKLLSLSEGYLNNSEDIDLSGFKDASEIQPWSRPYMNYCITKEWIKGQKIGESVYLKPNDVITRAEAAAMISRALGLSAVNKTIRAEFRDKDKIPDWAAGYIDELLEKKLMQGYPDGTFGPNNVLTRAEAAKIFDIYLTARDKDIE